MDARDAPCVLAIDPNRIAAIESQFGHFAGDAMLCEVARRLAAFAREHRTLAGRLVGDEFVLVSDADPGNAATRHLANALRSWLDQDSRDGIDRLTDHSALASEIWKRRQSASSSSALW